MGINVQVVLIAKGENDSRSRAQRLNERIMAEKVQGRVYQQKSRIDTVMGFVAITRLGKVVDPRDSSWVFRGLEVKGFTAKGGRFAIGQVDGVALVDAKAQESPRYLKHPKFAHVHTVEFSKTDPDRILITSTGADRIFEVSILTGEITWEWNPWQHGYSTNKLGLTLAARGDPLPQGENVRILGFAEAERIMRAGESVPKGQTWINVVDFEAIEAHYKLEKWQKTTSPNSATYGERPGTVLASLFRTGQVIEIDKETGQARVLLDGLAKPHGPIATGDGYLVSDTGQGRVLMTDKRLKTRATYDFSHFPLRAGLEERASEWIQNAARLNSSLFTAVDARRNTVFVWDPQKGIYSAYPFDPNMSLQAVLPFSN